MLLGVPSLWRSREQVGAAVCVLFGSLVRLGALCWVSARAQRSECCCAHPLQVLYSTAAAQCRLRQWQEARATLEKAVVWRPEGRTAILDMALERVQVKPPLWVPGCVYWAQVKKYKIRMS